MRLKNEVINTLIIAQLSERSPNLKFIVIHSIKDAILLVASRDCIVWYLILECRCECSCHVQLFCDPMDCSPPGSSVYGISQARILEWIAISFSRVSSWPRDQTHIPCIDRWILYHWDTRKAPAEYIYLFKLFNSWHTTSNCNRLLTSPEQSSCLTHF